MILYRSIPKRESSVEDFSATYTLSYEENGQWIPIYGSANNKQIYVNNGNVIIGQFVNDYYRMINIYSGNCNIYVRGQTIIGQKVASMLRGTSSQYRKNIYFHKNLNSLFNVTDNNSIIGQNISWTIMQNGFYNFSEKIYCYYNYNG